LLSTNSNKSISNFWETIPLMKLVTVITI
jgi:hypothetical protein